MSVIGAAVILGLVVAGLVRMNTARPVVVVVCVLFGLVLGATPMGDALYLGVASIGVWLSDALASI